MKLSSEHNFGVSADVQFSWLFGSVSCGVTKPGNLVILMSPVCQSISRLCSMSHVCPRNDRGVAYAHDMECACSECLCIRLSDDDLCDVSASLGVLSTL